MKINNKGVSLIELLVSVAIMSIVMLIATAMLTNASRFFEKQSAQVELQNEAQVITNYLTESIMEASGMEFVITNSGTGAGVYRLYGTETDPTSGTAILTGKGDQRVLYYDADTFSLYMVSFNATDAIPDPSTYASIGFLISDEIRYFSMDVNKGEVTDPNEPTETDADGNPIVELGVRNPITCNIKFTLAHNKVSSDFELTADCRNHLSEVSIEKDGNPAEVYKAYDR